MLKFMRPIGQSVTVLVDVLGVCVVICETNCIVMCMRLEMAMKFCLTKWNRCWRFAMNSNPRVSLFT